MRLVMWDVDHTLMETGGVGAQVYAEAFESVTGVPMLRHADVTGATERALFAANLDLNRTSGDPALFERFATAQATGYRRRTPDLRRRGRALPGAHRLLDQLAEHPDVVQTVVTGNTRESARIKLDAFELSRHLDLDVGAYGTDSDDRARLVELARQRARGKYPGNLTTAVLIGDTPADIRAGLAADVHVIGVATGRPTTTDLRATGATLTVASLTDLSITDLI